MNLNTSDIIGIAIAAGIWFVALFGLDVIG